jgi:hypothetical protein
MMRESIILIGIIVVTSSFLYPQHRDSTFSSERPAKTLNPHIVPKGVFQIETGIAFQRFYISNSSKVDRLNYNATNIRFGVNDNIEVRVGFSFSKVKNEDAPYYEQKLNFDHYYYDSYSGVFQPYHIKTREGFDPLEMGIKIKLLKEKSWRPAIALIGTLHLPTIMRSWERKKYEAGGEIRAAFAHSITKNVTFGYNLGGSWDIDKQKINYLYSFSLNTALMESMDAFIELDGRAASRGFGEPWLALGGGLKYSLRPNLQLDLSGGHGLSKNAPDTFFGFGLTFQLP